MCSTESLWSITGVHAKPWNSKYNFCPHLTLCSPFQRGFCPFIRQQLLNCHEFGEICTGLEISQHIKTLNWEFGNQCKKRSATPAAGLIFSGLSEPIYNHGTAKWSTSSPMPTPGVGISTLQGNRIKKSKTFQLP